MSKFEFGDIIRGAVIALGSDELNEVPCVGIVVPYDHVGATDQQGTVIISGSYRGYTFPSVDEDHFELVPEEELGHLNLL